jgi:hypothetical protein
VDVTVAELRLEAFLAADEATASNLTNLGWATARRGWATGGRVAFIQDGNIGKTAL